MTIISNPFALACLHLPQKYTISTLQSTDIADNQCDYGCIYKFTRFPIVKKERSNAFIMSASRRTNPDRASA